ncbi:hypothetical protein HJG54_35355 (plasmid) [Leptolyngbya sp. NK1-12]|uniref:Uncharacterized protein n=1 Tax=Leptolyngbya sp. NK1-12 TaxID=2547451 RepID=A0AA96WLU3_9CYAN|nr:hypothetical protein [Leptolyngbya sp. NK1-12]WNZ28192.1 hypothetical protein HJG54_35355 [Leptolyngbya sp. NK1-12]
MKCPQCRFFDRLGCAIRPDYWKAWYKLHRWRGETDLFEALAPFLTECPDFEATPLKPLTLSLTEQQWNAVLTWSINPDTFNTFETFRAQVQQAFGPPAPDPTKDADDTPF